MLQHHLTLQRTGEHEANMVQKNTLDEMQTWDFGELGFLAWFSAQFLWG